MWGVGVTIFRSGLNTRFVLGLGDGVGAGGGRDIGGRGGGGTKIELRHGWLRENRDDISCLVVSFHYSGTLNVNMT